MMNKYELFLCSNPILSIWQLGSIQNKNNFVLIGWSGTSTQIDAGVPDIIKNILINTMTQMAQVSFLTDKSQIISEHFENTECIKGYSLNDITYAMKKELPMKVYYQSTDNPEIASPLFQCSSYPWELQQQMVFLSPKTNLALNLDKKLISYLFGENWLSRQYSHLFAVLRPGVDGDVIGMAFYDDDFKKEFILKLSENTQYVNDCLWLGNLTEQQFIEHLK